MNHNVIVGGEPYETEGLVSVSTPLKYKPKVYDGYKFTIEGLGPLVNSVAGVDEQPLQPGRPIISLRTPR